MPKPCFFEDFYGPYTKASEKGSYFLTEYSTHQLFTQLTLLQQVRGAAGTRRGRGPTPGLAEAAKASQGQAGIVGLRRHFLEQQMGRRKRDWLPRTQVPRSSFLEWEAGGRSRPGLLPSRTLLSSCSGHTDGTQATTHWALPSGPGSATVP